MEEPRAGELRGRVLGALFGLLYRNRALYWLASTIPFAGQWRVWQRLVLPRLRGRDVLEVGCGIGTLLADMVGAGYVCAAIDRSPWMVDATRAELRRRGLPPRATPVLRAEVERLPFADASFDSVVSTFPTEYIADPAAWREFARVLRPGGRVIVVLGAALLPTRVTLLPLVALQTLVYGRGPAAAGVCAAGASGPSGVAARIPDDVVGLAVVAECVRGPFWEAHLLLAEKGA